MKTCIRTSFPRLMMKAGLGWMLLFDLQAQTFTTLYNFNGVNVGDGSGPSSGLIVSDNTMYGATLQGGTSDYGIVFALNTDGGGYTNLHTFVGLPGDGTYPQSRLLL